MPTTGARELFSTLQTAINPATVLAGLETGWQAPLAVFDAPGGFGKANWIAALPFTNLAYRISGANVLCRAPACAGATSSLRRNIGFQPKGTTNAASCSGPIRFAQIYLPGKLINRVGAEVGRPAVGGALRDDLWFFEDDRLERLVADYVARALDRTFAPTQLEMEARSVLLVEHLVTRHHGGGTAAPARGGLAPWAVQRVIENIEALTAEDHSVA